MAEEKFTILIVEDDPNDVLLMKRALAKTGIDNPAQVVPDGERAVEYLTGTGPYADRQKFPFPGLILTDLKMPRMSGIELLKWLKHNPHYRVIPTIVLTSSMEKSDIQQSYFYGANSYLVKPGSFEELQKMMSTIFEYWFMCRVALPEVFSGEMATAS